MLPSSGSWGTEILVGRVAELEQLRRTLDCRDGDARWVLVTGDPGIGKSAVLAAVRDQAQGSGARVISIDGTPAEQHLPFAGLHQLLVPLTGHLSCLPPGQRAAAESALGLGESSPPKVFLMGVAALGLVTAAAAEQDLLIVIDDLDRIDAHTQVVLGFLVRRLSGHRATLVAAARSGYDGGLADLGLVLELKPLPPDDAEQLLLRSHPTVDGRTKDFLLSEAEGNPLVLVELHKAVPRVSHVPAADMATDAALTRRLRQAFGGLLPGLPPATRAALLVAATYSGSRADLVLSAASTMFGSPVTVRDLEAAVTAGLLGITGATLTFHHPMVRWVVLNVETATRRLAAHAALGETLALDPAARVLHRAHATVGEDDRLADELAVVGAREMPRDSMAHTIRCLQRSAELTSDPARRGHRYVAAAERSLWVGDADLTDALVTLAAELPLSRRDQLAVEWARDVADEAEPRDERRSRRLCQLAGEAAALGDGSLALDVLGDASVLGTGSGSGGGARHGIYDCLRALTRHRDDPRFVAALALTAPMDDVRTARVLFTHVERAQVSQGQINKSHVLQSLGLAAHALGDAPRALDYLGGAQVELRRQGATGRLIGVLLTAVADQLTTGDWAGAEASIQEVRRFLDESDHSVRVAALLTCRAHSAALRGDLSESLELAGRAELLATERRVNALLGPLRLARGCAWAGVGRFSEAYEELRHLFTRKTQGPDVRQVSPAVMFLAESAAHTDHRLDAVRLIDRWAELAIASPAPVLVVHLSYARAVLAPDDEAEHHYELAFGQDLHEWPFVQAMLQSAYGGWLRRQRRIVESRGPIRSALATFDFIGARGWAARARSELAAAGERHETSSEPVQSVLSPQQLEIAHLAARGMSNREIGERLFLSPRTVGSHLYRMFPKLGVTSRIQLAQRLDGRAALSV